MSPQNIKNSEKFKQNDQDVIIEINCTEKRFL